MRCGRYYNFIKYYICFSLRHRTQNIRFAPPVHVPQMLSTILLGTKSAKSVFVSIRACVHYGKSDQIDFRLQAFEVAKSASVAAKSVNQRPMKKWTLWSIEDGEAAGPVKHLSRSSEVSKSAVCQAAKSVKQRSAKQRSMWSSKICVKKLRPVFW